MPSDLMSSDQFVTDDQIQTKTVTVKRISNTNNVGSRMWFALSDQDDVIFQKWSLLMDEADALLMLTQPGDKYEVEYWVEIVCDPVHKRIIGEFTRNNITKLTPIRS